MQVASIDGKVVSIACSSRSIEARVASIEAKARSIERSVRSIERELTSLEGAAASIVATLMPLTRDQSQSHKTPDGFPAGFAPATHWIPS
jgi:hypothetical protein